MEKNNNRTTAKRQIGVKTQAEKKNHDYRQDVRRLLLKLRRKGWPGFSAKHGCWLP